MNTSNIFDIHMFLAFILYLIIALYIFGKVLKTLWNDYKNYTYTPLEEIEILIDDFEHVKTETEKR